MTNKNEDKDKAIESDIFTYDGWNEYDVAVIGFDACTMLRDFGPLKKGEKYESITIDCQKSKIEAYPVGAYDENIGDLDEAKVISFKIKLEPA